MSTHCHLRAATMCNLRHIQRQMRLLDMRLQMLRDKLCAARLHRCALPCCCLHHSHHLARKALCTRLELERRIDRLRRLGLMLSSCCCPSPLALCAGGFHPHDVTVTMKDGRVKVSAERTEEHNTCLGKRCSYRKFTKEFSLPPSCCCDKEVTCSVKSDTVTEVVEEPKCCSYICHC